MDSKALADKIVEILDSKKGIDIEVIDVSVYFWPLSEWVV